MSTDEIDIDSLLKSINENLDMNVNLVNDNNNND
jgi:hypothetical protein